MYALLAICQALCPTKVDEGISTAMKEKFGDQHAKMVRGGFVFSLFLLLSLSSSSALTIAQH